MTGKFLSVAEAATALVVHRTRINQLIDSGVLPAIRIGRAYVIREVDLELVKERPAPGRPKKADEAEAIEASRVSAPLKPRPTKANGVKKATKKRAAKRRN